MKIQTNNKTIEIETLRINSQIYSGEFLKDFPGIFKKTLYNE